MSSHCTEDELILYHYGEARWHRRIQRHLASCEACRAVCDSIAGTLALVAKQDVPERDEHYGLEVWQRIRHQLPEQEAVPWIRNLFRRDHYAMAAVAAGLTIAAFVAGLSWPRPAPTAAPDARTAETSRVARPTRATDAQEHILLAAVADHLDRSERVLTDIMNGPTPSDISIEQEWAGELLTTNRLYRQEAIDENEALVASVLDELERSLLEIVHSPSKSSAATLESLRRRIDAASLVFKVRVMSDELRDRNSSSPDHAADPSTRIVS